MFPKKKAFVAGPHLGRHKSSPGRRVHLEMGGGGLRILGRYGEASETGRAQRRAGSTFATAWTLDGAKSLCPAATARPLTSAVRVLCVRSCLCFSFICLRGERERKEPLKTDGIGAKEANGGHPESTRASRGNA